jgi:micrococcal nuclease
VEGVLVIVSTVRGLPAVLLVAVAALVGVCTTSHESAIAPRSIPDNAEGPFRVDRVVDGDTVLVRRDGRLVRVRLIGMDTPEIVDPRRGMRCFGREASAQAKKLLTGAQVYLAADASQDRRDRYGRELDYLWLADGQFFNQIMIRQGFALEYTYDLPYHFQDAFRAAQREAERQSRGLWATSACDGDVAQPARSRLQSPATSPNALLTAAIRLLVPNRT